jgi:hypothetical protein
MGEAKRRKKLDPNYGHSNALSGACKLIDTYLSTRNQPSRSLQEMSNQADSIFLIFSNNERGCSEEEIKLLKVKIPQLYQGENFRFYVLPKKFANVPTESALKHLEMISVS